MSVLKLYNPDAYANNTIVMHKSKSGCCNGTLEFCKYLIQMMLTNVTAITIQIDGNPEVVTFDAPANTPREIRKAIAKALKSKGYDPYYEDAWKGVSASTNEVCIVGEAIPVSLTVDGEEKTFEKRCETAKVCKFKGELSYDTDAGKLGDTQIGTPTGFPAGDTAPVITALTAALDAEGVDYTKVDVSESEMYETYVYCIHKTGEGSLTIGGEEVPSCGCYPDFIPSLD